MSWTRGALLSDEHRSRLLEVGVEPEVLAGVSLSALSGGPLGDWWHEWGNALYAAEDVDVPVRLGEKLVGYPCRDALVVVASPVDNLVSLLVSDTGATVFVGPGSELTAGEIFCGGGSSVVLNGDVTATRCAVIDARNGGSVVAERGQLWAADVYIATDDMHRLEDLATGVRTNPYGARIRLGEHVWLGRDVVLTGDVEIGDQAVLDASVAFPAPEALDDAEAASLFIGYQTGWFGLHRRAAVQPGETLLVHAAAGGVGSAAVQLGKAAGARVIGVVGGPEKAEVARALGADVVVDRHREDFVEVVKAETGGRGADVVYDPVGGSTYTRSTKCIAFEGRILVVGFAGGEIQSAALNHALVKNYSVVGLHWGLYNLYDPPAVAACHEALTEMAARGEARPLVSERLSFADLPDGVQRLADGTTVGRVVMVGG